MLRVRSWERASELAALCAKHNWQYVVGIEEQKPEDLSDLEALLASSATSGSSGPPPDVLPTA
jgi:hypothetical protein